MNYTEQYEQWLKNATEDPDLIPELLSIKDNPTEISERFFRDLEFGTGGLRGIIGSGTNRMNVYTVGKATQGIADYVNSVTENGKVAIAYDSRIKSKLFAEKTASVFAANGITAYIYKELMPTPMLSYAVRHLGCDAGVVITASHNPSKYNGYKAYGPDGCQLNLEASELVLSYIEKIDVFNGIKTIDFEKAVEEKKIIYIDDEVIDSYIKDVENQSINTNVVKKANISVIYTPLHGSGNKPVRRILDTIGIKNVTIVKEQELPDGNFPTAPYPNPEISQPFEIAMEIAKTTTADILLATDPDCDRVGIAVNHNGQFQLMSGNQVGALLLNYILLSRSKNGSLPEKPVAVKTIVTTELCQKIADKYGCELKNVLTGFKFIGEQIAELEAVGQENRYIFGFEESYGYLSGGYVRDKDAVNASMLICEMVSYYKLENKTLIDVYDELEKEFGCYLNKQMSFTFEGQEGMKNMSAIMENLRTNSPKTIDGSKVVIINDYLLSKKIDLNSNTENKILLPQSNVIEFILENGCSLIVRPSGTEPKIKIYISVCAKQKQDAENCYEGIQIAAEKLMKY